MRALFPLDSVPEGQLSRRSPGRSKQHRGTHAEGGHRRGLEGGWSAAEAEPSDRTCLLVPKVVETGSTGTGWSCGVAQAVI